MHFERDEWQAPPSGRLRFAPAFHELLARSAAASLSVEIAGKAEIDAALAHVGAELEIADAAAVEAVRRRNPELFRVIRAGTEPAQWSMMAYLALNGAGLAALIDGTFEGRAPDPEQVCRPGEAPEALYLWLIYAPRRLSHCLRLIEHLATIGEGVPLFSRPINANSARVLESIGFGPAGALFPDAAPSLRVLLPEAPARRRIEIAPVTSLDMLMKVFAVRSATYMAEQRAPFTEEFDGNDFCATHLLGSVDGDAAGCARIRYFGDFAKFERFAVRPEYRGTALTPRLARACIAHVRMKGFRRVYAHARHDLVPLWERFGARVLEDRPAFRFSGVLFREMVLDIEPADDAITFGATPLRTIRPEGHWLTAGPLDRSLLTPGSEGRAR
jgi:predicted GNAT family N-acyltransferase